MDNIVWIVLPWIFIVGIYVYIFSRKREAARMKTNVKNFDWLTFFALVLGANVFAAAMSDEGLGLSDAPWLASIPLLIVVVILIIAIVRRVRTGQPIVRIMGDERVEMIYAKGARNALFVTYLGLFVNLLVNDESALDARGLLIIIGSGLAVLLASIVVYYYRRS